MCGFQKSIFTFKIQPESWIEFKLKGLQSHISNAKWEIFQVLGDDERVKESFNYMVKDIAAVQPDKLKNSDQLSNQTWFSYLSFV